MGVVNVNSGLVTNMLATPAVFNNPYQDSGRPVVKMANIATGAADSNGSTYRYFRVPSNACVESISVMNDANTSGTSYKCGVYAINGGAIAVANADVIFFSAASMASARSVWTGLYFPSILAAGGSAANVGLRVWELLGLAADPQVEYDVVVVATTVGSAGGNMALKLSYLQ